MALILNENGQWRRETKPHMGRRLTGFDYGQRQIYLFTIVLEERRPILGRLMKGSLAARGKAQNGGEQGGQLQNSDARGEWAIEPSAFGEIVLECWRELPKQWPQVGLIEAQLMPDHFHGVLFVKEQLPKGKTLGNIIGAFKSRSTSRCLAAHGQAQNSCEGGSARGGVPPRFWAPGYVDTILFREGQLEKMINYVRDNPRRLGIKRENPDLFRVVCDLALPLGEGRIGHFAAIGNRFLLDHPLVQVQVSRRFFAYKRVAKSGGGMKIARSPDGEPEVAVETAAYREQAAKCLDAAKHGAVLLSPCVSDGERQIAHLALAAGMPLITMQNKGFSKLHKPPGRYFDACTEGRLLMLAPAAWPYTPGEKPMTRFDATAMNRLCQLIAGDDAVEINYHGMRPANIDKLAFAAVNQDIGEKA